MRRYLALALALVVAGSLLLASKAPIPFRFPTDRSAEPHDASQLTAVGHRLFFTAFDAFHGDELWVSDGTAAGTHLVRAIDPVPDVGPTLLSAVGGTLFFSNEVFPPGSAPSPTPPPATTAPLRSPAPSPSGPPPQSPVSALWKSDGTAAGTVPVRRGLTVRSIAALDGSALFFADDVRFRLGLWRSDGTHAGTVELRAFPERFGPRAPAFLSVAGGSLYFAADDGRHGEELWRTDGTRAGTALVCDIQPGPGSSLHPFALEQRHAFTALRGRLFFQADDGLHGSEVWSTGGPSGARMVRDVRAGGLGSAPQEFVTVDGRLFFRADDGRHGPELWSSDGIASTTRMVRDIRPGRNGSRLIGAAAFDGGLFFSADDGRHGPELWSSNGTARGTHLARDLRPGGAGSYPTELSVSGRNLFFITNDDAHSERVWKRTTGGTIRLLSPFGYAAEDLTVAGGLLYFRAYDDTRGFALWRSDGTKAGTRLVEATSSHLAWITAIGPGAYFAADDGIHGDELWTSDGTAAGTRLVRDIVPGAGESSPRALNVVGGVLFFIADDGVHGRELWRSDGTSAGTRMVKDIRPGRRGAFLQCFADCFAAAGSTLFFAADDGVHGDELWSSDGTAAGTRLVRDIRPGPKGATDPSACLGRCITTAGQTVFFSADDGTHGRELWRSDGTGIGTSMVRDSIPGKDGVLPDQLTAVGGRLFFNGYDDAHGEELWTSDGTAAGTHLVKDLAPGRRPGSLGDLTAFDGGVFFFSSGLFRSDGTSAGTVRVKGGLGGEGMVVVGTTLFVFTDDALWKSDGTSVGTVVVKSGPLEWLPEPGSSIGSTEFFTAADDVHGRELWSTDGTDPGTRLVRDIWPGPNPPAFVLAPGPFATAGATLLFGADDGAHGSELWRSDGTKAGTALVRDIAG